MNEPYWVNVYAHENGAEHRSRDSAIATAEVERRLFRNRVLYRLKVTPKHSGVETTPADQPTGDSQGAAPARALGYPQND